MTARIVAILADGEITAHAGGALFNYSTLCGLDGDEYPTVPLMPGAVIDCPQCIALWEAWRTYKAGDFKAAPGKPKRRKAAPG